MILRHSKHHLVQCGLWILSDSASDPYRQESNGVDKMTTYFNPDTSNMQLMFLVL
jgi:hypothetical protein